MPCLIVLFALIAPRLVVFSAWFFSDWFGRVFDTLLWPVLGFIFLPTTLLWYTAVQNWWGGRWGVLQVAGIVVALMIDGSPSQARRRAG